MNEAKPQPQQKTWRKSLGKDLMIKEAWAEMDKEHK